MIGVLLALSCALSYGIADYIGGHTSRQASAHAVIAKGQTASLIVLGIVIAVLADPFPGADDLVVGAISGAIGAFGLLAFYTAMARGPIVVVSPIAALVSMVIPVAIGIAQGERPRPLAMAGIAVAAVAVVMVSVSTSAHAEAVRPKAGVIALAMVAGIGFGGMFAALDSADDDAALWPLLGLRVVSIPLVLLIASVQKAPLRIGRRRVLVLAAVGGSLDMVANAFFLEASTHGDLSIVSALASLYPAATVVMALALDREKVSRVQVVGMVLALVAIVAISVGRS